MDACDGLVAEAALGDVDDAVEGETVPVYYRGRKVGEYVRFNDRLLIAALLASSSAARDAANSLRNDAFAFTGPVR